MADVTIDGSAQNVFASQAPHRGIVWTDKDTGYVFYNSFTDNFDLVYKKTTDGGATWDASFTKIKAGTVDRYSIWYDKWTKDDTGGIIHIVYLDRGNGVYYRSLDTSDDSLSSEVAIDETDIQPDNANYSSVSITKSRGGKLFVAAQDGDSPVGEEFYDSTDGGANWNTKTNNPFEGGYDFIELFPANLADDDDIWGLFHDFSANEIDLKTWDDSAGTWSTTNIATGMDESTDAATPPISGTIRHSDGHLLVCGWNLVEDVNGDIKTWDINGSGSITAKSDVLTDANRRGLVSISINQQNDDVYVFHSDDRADNVIVYSVSTDDMSNWTTDQAYMEGTADDLRVLFSEVSTGDDGGRVGGVWFNDDTNDLQFNKVNSIEIDAAASGGTKTFTIDAVIQQQDLTKTFTIDAIIQKLDFTKTFTIDAIIQGLNQTKTFTIDTVIKLESITKTFTVDTVIQLLNQTKTFTIDTVIKALNQTKTFTIDSVIQKLDFTKTFTIDTVIQKLDFTKTFTIDAVITAASTVKTFTIDTVIQKLNQSKTFTIDTVIQKLNQLKTFTIDAIIQQNQTKTFTIDTVIKGEKTKTFTIDAVIKALGKLKTFTIDAVINPTPGVSILGTLKVKSLREITKVKSLRKTLKTQDN